MRVLVAPQEYKGTLTAVEAAQTMATAVREVLPPAEVDILPMADGGPGTAAALLEAAGGELRHLVVHDPLMRRLEASWALLASGTAVVECAAASGLVLLRRQELDPRRASSFGTGELIADALASGCRQILVGLGGSATNDAGAGMAQALGFRLLDGAGAELPPGGAALAGLARIDSERAVAALASTRFIAASDVENPLVGPEGASAVYGPQKGADQAAIAALDAALTHFAGVIERDLSVSVRALKGGGAAGGLGAACIAFLRAELQSGARVVGDAARLAERIARADLVLTGEGRLDRQTAYGKATFYVAALCRQAATRVVCLPGSLGPGYEDCLPLFDLVLPLEEGGGASARLRQATKEALTRLGAGPA